MSSYARANLRITNEKQKENSHEGITWSEMGKQNVQAEKVYSSRRRSERDCNFIKEISQLFFPGFSSARTATDEGLGAKQW